MGGRRFEDKSAALAGEPGRTVEDRVLVGVVPPEETGMQ